MLFLLIILNVFYIIICPFTKVEESFNIQAIHDILNYKLNVSKFDHITFPGVVPRTFTIPFFISFLTFPIKFLFHILDFPKYFQQSFSRAIISFFSIFSHYFFSNSLKKSYGKNIAFYYFAITISQFHINFYSSRPLPNVFALIISLFSISFYLKRNYKCFIIVSGVVILLIRTELSIFFGLLLLAILINKKISFSKFFQTAFVTALFSLGISIPFDSYFWQRIVWPEAEVLIFNTILNRSSEWGTHPFLWYFYSALPRCLLTSIILSITSCFYKRDSKITELVIYGLVFVFIYSFLPHKELRFIIYVVPIFNAAAAHFWQIIYEKSTKSNFYAFLNKCLWLMLTLNVLVTIFLSTISHYNYPGGEAIYKLNTLPNITNKDVHVHICNLAAQTGVTRFHEEHDNWIYNKTENIDKDPVQMSMFTHIILEMTHKAQFESMMKSLNISYQVLFDVKSYSGLSKVWPFYRLSPSLVILERI